jgi:hypothetical protein
MLRVAAGKTSNANDPKKSGPPSGVKVKYPHTSPGGVSGVFQP